MNINGESLNIQQDKLEKLQQLFPDVFSEGKIDWEKLKAAFGDDINFSNERYVLNWAGKADAFKVLQIPTTHTLKPQPQESINFDTTQNIFIEGENLEVLKVLQKSYYGKVKCIIIDPPYNTGNDSFIYPDSFKENKLEYEKRVGDKDEEGYLMKEGLFRKNSKDSGQFHSNWLNMMHPRLFLAKNLLCDDGVIFIHIDDNEVHNLRLLMNEVFGEENFLAELIWKKKYIGGKHAKHFVDLHEYVLVYSKYAGELKELLMDRPDKEKVKFEFEDEYSSERGKYYLRGLKSNLAERKTLVYPIYLPDGSSITTQWMVAEKTFEELKDQGRIVFKEKKDGDYNVYRKFYEFDNDGRVKVPSLIEDVANADGKVELKEIFEIKEGREIPFQNPKPTKLLKYLITPTTGNQDIILDFFGGSGTMAQAVLEQNKEDGEDRKFILVQLPEQCDEGSEAYKAGYKFISDISKERIRRVIKRIETEKVEKPDMFDNGNLDLGFKVFKLSPSNFKIWQGDEIDEDNLEETLDMFIDPVREGSTNDNMLYELMLKAGYVLTDSVERKDKYFSINDGELIIALEEMSQPILDTIIAAKPQKVITLDNLFTGKDQLKTNAVLQMRDAEIDFKTI